MNQYYRRDGTPYSDMMEWARDFEHHQSKIVEQTTLSNGRWISTVWLGLDHNYSISGPPLIFETMAFTSPEDFHELDCDRYATEADARLGHRRMIKKWEGEPDE